MVAVGKHLREAVLLFGGQQRGSGAGDTPDPVERVSAAAPPAPGRGAGYVVGSGRVSHRSGQQRGRGPITVTALGEFLGGGGLVVAESVPLPRSQSGCETWWFEPVARTSMPVRAAFNDC